MRYRNLSMRVEEVTGEDGVRKFRVVGWPRKGCVGKPAETSKDIAFQECAMVSWQWARNFVHGVIIDEGQ